MASLLQGVVQSLQRDPSRPALILGHHRYSYGELTDFAAPLAALLREEGRSSLVAVLASESLTAYGGLLAALAARRGLLPLEPADPPLRLAGYLLRSEADTLIVGLEALDRLETLLKKSPRPLTAILPEAVDLRGLASRHPRHRLLLQSDLPSRASFEPLAMAPGDPAFLFFRSSTRGVPQALLIHHGAAASYLESALRLSELTPRDRVAHTAPFNQNHSFHDPFCAWSAGAALIPWIARHRSDPARFLLHHQITHWKSAASIALTMERTGALLPRSFPTLRTSLFAGPHLRESTARAWSEAAPNSRLIHLYGPPEATAAISAYHWDRLRSSPSCRRGLVPIGQVFPGHRALILDDQGLPLSADNPGTGELHLQGPQVLSAYPGAPEESARRFLSLPEHGPGSWLRTGDRVEVDETGTLHFLGSADQEFQLRGHRIALAEVDAALKQACDHDQVAAIPWPRDAASVYGLVAFVAEEPSLSPAEILAGCRRCLPAAMIPDRIISIEKIPRDHHGEPDRFALERILKNSSP